jgi:uncharacterized protein YjiS (DUF1127 family)
MTTINTISGRAQTDRLSVRINEMTGAGFRGTIVAMAQWMQQASARRRGRLALEQMTNAQLKDIGLTRMQAELEAAKPFWR